MQSIHNSLVFLVDGFTVFTMPRTQIYIYIYFFLGDLLRIRNLRHEPWTKRRGLKCFKSLALRIQIHRMGLGFQSPSEKSVGFGVTYLDS